jgi:hypothetical protein
LKLQNQNQAVAVDIEAVAAERMEVALVENFKVIVIAEDDAMEVDRDKVVHLEVKVTDNVVKAAFEVRAVTKGKLEGNVVMALQVRQTANPHLENHLRKSKNQFKESIS